MPKIPNEARFARAINGVRLASNVASTVAYYAESKVSQWDSIPNDTVKEAQDIETILVDVVERIKKLYNPDMFGEEVM